MSKAKMKDLNVDLIGGERSLTKEDEQAISDFLNRQKQQSKLAKSRQKTMLTKRPKSIA